jgi:signal transduction histidine kinase
MELAATHNEPGLLETVPEGPLAPVTNKVALALNAPIAAVALVEAGRVFLKSSVGLPEPWASLRELPLSASFSGSVVATKKAMVVSDRWRHPTLRHRLPDLDVTAYAGVPLVSSEGAVLGTLSVLDPRPRQWSGDEIAMLIDFAGRAATLVELHLNLARWKRSQTELQESQQQLQQAQKLASVGLFAGGIAHDFNNLLTVILSSVTLLEDTLADRSQAREELEEIEAAARRGAALTRQLLAFARKQVREPQLLDVNELTRSTERLLRRVIHEHIELTMDLTPSPGLIWADPGQLEQVLVNLGLNARDAMPAGGRLRIATAVVDLDAAFRAAHPDALPVPHVEISISDTGHGMTPEIMARIFEPLFSTKSFGTGLGLPTVKQIVEQHGGEVAVDSTEGEGSTFIVWLPAESPLPLGEG